MAAFNANPTSGFLILLKCSLCKKIECANLDLFVQISISEIFYLSYLILHP